MEFPLFRFLCIRSITTFLPLSEPILGSEPIPLEKRIEVRSLHPGLHIQYFLNQELAYYTGSDIDIGRSGAALLIKGRGASHKCPSLLLDFDDLPAGGSSKVGRYG